MQAGRAIRRDAVRMVTTGTVLEAAELMAQLGVGAVVVVDGEDCPVGVVTDRDITCRAVARGLTADSPISAVMSSPVVTIEADEDLHNAPRKIRAAGVRRLAVVEAGRLLGVISVDDMVVDLVNELHDTARAMLGEMISPDERPAVGLPRP